MTVTVEPAEFRNVNYDAGEMRRAVERVIERVGLDADTDVRVTVNEAIATSLSRLDGLDPVEVYIESGAIEHPKQPRQLSIESVEERVGMHLLEVVDRATPDFDAPPLSDEIVLDHRVAWDCYLVGRLARRGGRVQRQRRLYQFRHRHGFSDVATEAFDQLWSADDLRWSDIVRLSSVASSVGA